MTSQEQAELLLDALRRVLTDLDVIAEGTLNALDPDSLSDHRDTAIGSTFEDYPAPRVETIHFAPDEGSTAPAVNVDIIRSSARRARVVDLLRQIETEIDS
jgi:hypothetical protein